MSRRTDRFGQDSPRARRSRRPNIEWLEGRALLTTFTVTNALSSGGGSLAAAIAGADADSSPSADTITFTIPGTGVEDLKLTAALPAITRPVTVDGTTEAGVAIDGSSIPAAAGLTVDLASDAGIVTIEGLSIVGFSGGTGIVLEGAAPALVEGNLIGVMPDGVTPDGNGVGIMASGTSVSTIGGPTAATGNTISANSGPGVEISGASDLVEGNAFGLTKAGAAAAGLGNKAGLIVDAPNATIVGNTIGGSTGLPDVTPTGSATYGGILVTGGGDAIESNVIGLDAAGHADPNAGDGILVGTDATASTTAPVALNDTIGSTVAGAGNTIVGNTGAGVAGIGLAAGTYTGLSIRGNSISGNGGLGIDVGGTGTPVPSTLFITRLISTTTSVTIAGVDFGVPGAPVTVDFYGSGADATGYGQGATYLGSTSGTFGSNGFDLINVTFVNPAMPSEVGATSTDANGNTSGFSANDPLAGSVPTTDLALVASPSSTAAAVGGFVTLTETITNAGATAANNVVYENTLGTGLTVARSITSLGTTGFNPATNSVVAALGSLAPGQVATVTILAIATGSGRQSDLAGVSSTTADPNYGNNLASFVVMVAPSGGGNPLAIVQAPSATSVPANDPVTYTVYVGNMGTTPETDVTIDDFVPAGSTITGLTPTQGAAALKNGVLVTDDLGTIAPGGIAALIITVIPNIKGTAINTAYVSGDQFNPSPTNFSSVATTVTAPVPNIKLALLQSPSPAIGEVGQFLVFTQYVANTGTDPATNVTLNQALPAGTLYGTAVASNGAKPTILPGALTVDFGTLAPGAIVALQLYVVPTAAGPVTDTAAVLSPDVPSYAPVFASAAVPVIAGPTVSTVMGLSANRALVLGFDATLNPTTAGNIANYGLVAMGPADAGPTQLIPLTAVSYNATNNTVTLLPPQALVPNEYYELVVFAGVTDAVGHHLASSVYAAAGTNYVTTFYAGNLPQV